LSLKITFAPVALQSPQTLLPSTVEELPFTGNALNVLEPVHTSLLVEYRA